MCSPERKADMIAIGSDHGGYELKMHVMEHLKERGIACKDYGCFGTDSCDYPDFGKAAARAVAEGECDRGIVVCTTGIGISIAANKVKLAEIEIQEKAAVEKANALLAELGL